MDDNQKKLLRIVKENLDNTRDLLDVIMHSPSSSETLSLEEHTKLKSIYDSVCEAINKTF